MLLLKLTLAFLLFAMVQIKVIALEPVPSAAVGNSKAGNVLGGSDYLPLEEDDEEFPEESIQFMRSMAKSFRSGFAESLTKVAAPSADSLGGESGDNEEISGTEAKESGSSQIFKYLEQIMEGFRAMRKSMSDMFQQIATLGGQRLAKRLERRMSTWTKQVPNPGNSPTPPAASEDVKSATKPFRK